MLVLTYINICWRKLYCQFEIKYYLKAVFADIFAKRILNSVR